MTWVEAPDAFDSDPQPLLEQYCQRDSRGFLLLTAQRTVIAVNDSARKLLQSDTTLPAPILDIVRDINVGFAIGDAIHDRAVVVHETVLPDPDRLLQFRITPLLSAIETVSHVAVTCEDITQLRHLETVRRDFVANVSHELRTPLASINLLVETIQRQLPHDVETADRLVQRIGIETQAMNQLVDELLELSRLESGRLSLDVESIPIEASITSAVTRLGLMATDRGVELESDVQTELPEVLADRRAIEQVLVNLVHNAIKFTPSGGSVNVRARRLGPGVEVEVADTGVGIASGESERIFERFYKVDQGRNRGTGTGLGLAIVRHVLELHGSKLTVVSEVGHGSRFSFGLTVSPNTSEAARLAPTRP